MKGLPDTLVVVGAGRVGSAFVRAAEGLGVPVEIVGRAGGVAGGPPPAPGSHPILVCTRADDLEDVLARTPDERRRDLVFVQNGMIAPLLARHGLAGNTQGLVYFAATSRQGPIEPGAPSLFHGPHAAAIVAMLDAAGIPARVVPDREAFAREVATKLAWNLVFGLLGERFGETVGESATRRRDLVETLAAEAAPVLSRALGAEVPVAPLVERLVAYSLGIPTFRASVKELRWRNGWLAEAARAANIATPLHDRLLAETGHA
ncbi:MAG: ketopantoate reductase family protein [Myxococcota bacterium]